MFPAWIPWAVAATLGYVVWKNRTPADWTRPRPTGPLPVPEPPTPLPPAEGASSAWADVDYEVEVYPPGGDYEGRTMPPGPNGVSSSANCDVVVVGPGWWDRAGGLVEGWLEMDGIANTVEGLTTMLLGHEVPFCKGVGNDGAEGFTDEIRNRVLAVLEGVPSGDVFTAIAAAVPEMIVQVPLGPGSEIFKVHKMGELWTFILFPQSVYSEAAGAHVASTQFWVWGPDTALDEEHTWIKGGREYRDDAELAARTYIHTTGTVQAQA